ncbi:MAG: DUF6600 domain-containing protein [Chthoniobacter sp.]
MKTFRLFLVLAALLFAGVMAPAPARARDAVSFDFFYDSLAPYGEWVQIGDYGLCWRPTGMDPDWTPYSDGYWAYTDAGWTWVSYEEFGGIVYHYGRWIRLDDDSWCWTPDYEWGPAWVSWRSSDDYVGWAPLPPEAHWRPEVGISVWADREYDLGPGYYSFCRVHDFGAPVLRGVILNRRENVTIIRSTVNITNITYNRTYVDGPIIFNGGPNFAVVNRVSARPIPALKLVQEQDFEPGRHRGANGRVAFQSQTVGNQLIVAAPRVLRPTDPGEFRSRAKRILPGDSVTRGWGGVKDPAVQKELRQEMGRQAKGLTPTTAPARAVVATDLKVVPVKADPTATPASAASAEHRDRPDRPGKGPRPEGVVVQPNINPPTNPPGSLPATPSVKPAGPVTTTTPGNPPGSPNSVARERGRDRNDRNATPPGAPNGGNPNLKPFTAVPDTRPPQNPPTATGATPMPRTTSTDDNNAAKDRAAEQARIRGEQQQRMEQQRIDQQRQADTAVKQKQADAAGKQKQADMAAEQQRQVSAQQEAARGRAEDQRRREAADQQRQQQQQIQVQQQQQQLRQQQLQQQQEQQQRAMDARRAQDAARERARDQAESQQRPPQQPQRQLPPQPQPQPQQRQLPPQPQPQPQQQNNQPPRPGGGQQHSKGGSDKDKDKDKDRN